MARSTADNKNLGGRPRTGIGTLVGVRLQPDQLAALDAWIARQHDPKLSRPEAVRRMIDDVTGREPEYQMIIVGRD